MELRLVDITPSPDDRRKSDASLPVPDSPVVDKVTAAAAGEHLELPPLMLVEEITYPPLGMRPSSPDLRLVEDGAPSPREVSATVSALQLVDASAYAPTASAMAIPDVEHAQDSVGAPVGAVPTATAPAATAPAATALSDPFAVDARREYEGGHIDQPLWAHAVAQHGGDEPQAMAAYLRARATALKLERRQRRNEQLRTRVYAAGNAPRPAITALSQDEDPDEELVHPVAQPRRKLAYIAAPVALVLAVAAWWMLSPNGRDTVTAKDTVAGGAAAVGASKANEPGLPGAKPLVRPATDADAAADLAEKVQALKAAGNWNVLVLFATEWTRKQPANAAAWRELSNGYTNLRQWNDALEAGKKAVQLAPDDPLAWRNLGQVNLDVKEPDVALQAFERAAALKEPDAYTLLQLGTLNAQLDRLPQARAAFDRVLEANPGNLDALCGTALVAQRQGRTKDADAIAKQIRAADQKCPEVAAVAAAPAAAVPVPLSLSSKKLR